MGDAEDSGGTVTSESIAATTNGTSWQTVETYGSITVSNSGTTTTIYDPANGGGGTAVVETTASNLSLAITTYSSGGTAAAFGFYAPYDFSDAPLTGTSYAAASHRSLPGLRLGAAVTSEASAYDSADASADADDGMTVPVLFRSQAATLSLSVTGPGKLTGWIDWNDDGDFADSGEQVASSVQDGGSGDADGSANSTIALAVTPPASAATTPTIARFRWSASSGATSSSLFGFGEIEDYQLTVIFPSLSVTKISTLVSDPVNNTTQPKAIPGALMRYCVTVSNTGSAGASLVDVSDTLPANVTYATASLRSGTSCGAATTVEDDNATGTDDTDALGASYSGGTVQAQASTLAVGTSVAVTYDVTVN